MTFKQRAVTEEQKAERRQAILDSAQRLFQESDYASVSMAQIAAEAGVAKGTVFLYFETKEEVFLALSWQEYRKCFMELDSGLDRYLLSACSLEEFLDVVQKAFAENRTLLRLIAINSVILEQNIKYSTAVVFKRMLAKQVEHTGMLIERVLPFLQQGDGKRFLLQLQALAIGIQHLSEPAPIVKQVIKDEQLNMFCVNFNEFFYTTIKAILNGLETRGG